MLTTKKIDKNSVAMPVPRVSAAAFSQISLIKKHDYTLEGKLLRVAIKGKECDGFTYEVFFDEQKDDDFVCCLQKDGETISVLFDPFSAFYLPNVEINYILDHENNVDGFVINNPDQDLHKGKFWVQRNSKKPPMINA